MFGRYEKRILEYQRKAMEKQVAEVNEIYMTMRGWRHDYHNHLQKLGAHLKEGQIEEAKKYIGELGESLDDIKTKYQTGNVSLDAILNSKLSIVEKERIAINCKVEIGENLTVSDIDLCILLGNLIDNAVEACRGIPEDAERFLRIYMCIRKQQLYISVSNATNEVIRKLDAEYISKKRGDHGHGLKRINIVVDKYGGFVKRANEPGVFATEIMLPL
ncbi:MAG: GHKL domain-containing protein [Lachnospiraceae bacterium]|nr:GHKL domain-containing protein [Lachnospiraceae bacterium]